MGIPDRCNPRIWLRNSLRALSGWLWKLSPSEQAHQQEESAKTCGKRNAEVDPDSDRIVPLGGA